MFIVVLSTLMHLRYDIPHFRDAKQTRKQLSTTSSSVLFSFSMQHELTILSNVGRW